MYPANSLIRIGYLTVIGLFLLRLAIGAEIPLIADEAHYALYALKPAWSYFDHPPMVGWIQFIALFLGQDEWVIRLMPNLLHSLIAIAIMTLSLRLYGCCKIALISLFVFQTSPLLQLMGLGLLPDLPLILFTLLMLHSLLNLHQRESFGNWLLLGLSLGTMGLSKYTAIVLAIGLGLWILHFHREWLVKPPFWLAIILALILISPVVLWNINQDWISISYQLEHGELSNQQLSWQPFLEAQSAHLLSYGALLFVLSFASMQNLLSNQPKLALIAYLAIPYWLVFAYTSAKGGHYLPHWISAMMSISVPLVADLCRQLWLARLKLGRYLLIALAALTLSTPIIASLLIASNYIPEVNRTFFKQFAGWQTVAKKAAQYADQQTQSKTIFVPNWSQASRIAWYARPNAVQPTDSRVDQFDLWFGEFGKLGDGILVAHLNDSDLAHSLQQFKSCQLLEKPSYSIRQQHYHFGIWLCNNQP